MNALVLLLLVAVPSRLTMDPGTQRVFNFKNRCAPQSTNTTAVNVVSLSSEQILVMADGTGAADVFFSCNKTRIAVTVNRFDQQGREAEAPDETAPAVLRPEPAPAAAGGPGG